MVKIKQFSKRYFIFYIKATILRTEDGLESGMITTQEGSNQRQPELLRYGNTIYTIEERQPDS